MPDVSRRYRILSVLGQGGFGRVYKARLEGPQGFVKEVAIKLLSDTDAPESVLQRFRDESRILGLIRDRAIVNVDPPTRLDGRWAVVMEYVEGASLHQLRKRFGMLPPRVVLGVVQEAGRALEKVYRTNGPDGLPLHLVHRDIKPGNLQVTPSGELKILDFGIARAQFAHREAVTTTHVGGTLGYIAPERLVGVDGPAGDIYSLGVVMRVLLSGVSPRKTGLFDQWRQLVTDEDTLKTLELSDRMCAQKPDQRPKAREVEDLALELGRVVGGLSLRRWAEQNVSVTTDKVYTDELIGSLLTETLASVVVGVNDVDGLLEATPVQTRDESSTATTRAYAVAAVAVSVALATVFVLVGVVAGLLYWGAPDPTRVAATPQPSATSVNVVPEQALSEAPLAVDTDDIGGDSREEKTEEQLTAAEASATSATAAEEPSRTPVRSAPTARPAPKPAPAPEPTGPTYAVTFTSTPLGAAVHIDGKPVGSTPLVGHALVGGPHEVEMSLNGEVVTQTITVGRRAPTRYSWKVGEALQGAY